MRPKMPAPFSRKVLGMMRVSASGRKVAEVEGRLVELVEEAERRQHQTAADVELVADQEVQGRELHKDVALVCGAGVLELELGVEDQPVREAVARVEHGPDEVGLVGPAGALVGDDVGVLRLGVASDRESLGDAVDLGGRGPQPPGALERLLLGDAAELLPGAGQLLAQHLELLLELADPLLLGLGFGIGGRLARRRGGQAEAGQQAPQAEGGLRGAHGGSVPPGARLAGGSAGVEREIENHIQFQVAHGRTGSRACQAPGNGVPRLGES